MGGFRSGPIPGPPGPASELIAVPTVAALRADVPGILGVVRVLDGYFAASDSDQGLFQWVATPATDDGVFRFNFGGLGSSSAGWERIASGPIQAAWGGFLPTNTASVNVTQLAIVLNAALARQSTSVSNLVTSPQVNIGPGIYLINDKTDLDSFFGILGGENAILRQTDNTKDILANISNNFTLKGLLLEGGRDAISIGTSNLDTVVINIEDVSTRAIGRQHIKADLTSNSTILNVQNSRFLAEEQDSEPVFDFGSIDHVNFVDCWVTSARDVTWNNRTSRLRLRGGIYVPLTADGAPNDYWINNVNGSVWLFQNMFSGESPRRLLYSAAAADTDTVVSVEIRDNIIQAPSTEGALGPFRFDAIPNEIKITNNVGLLGITLNSGCGIDVNGYAAFGAQSYIDIDSQFLRKFSAASDNLTRNLYLAREQVHEYKSILTILDAARSLEWNQASAIADLGQQAGGTATVNTTTNDAGLTVYTVQATANGQYSFIEYISAITGLADGLYTLLVPLTHVGPGTEVLIYGGDVINRWHLSSGRRLLALPFVWEDGTTQDLLRVEFRDLPNNASVFIEPLELVAGIVDPGANYYGTAAPVGNSGHRWLKGTVIWDSNPTSGQFIGRVCTASSSRVAALSYDAGTWKTFGAIS